MASQAPEPPPPSASPPREPVQSDGESSTAPQPQKTANEVQNENPRSQSSASGTDGSRNAKPRAVRRRSRKDVARNQQHEDGDQGEYITHSGHHLAPQNQQVQDKGRGAPSVRLDMNLDIEIELKAKIKGDVTLSILGGKQGKK